MRRMTGLRKTLTRAKRAGRTAAAVGVLWAFCSVALAQQATFSPSDAPPKPPAVAPAPAAACLGNWWTSPVVSGQANGTMAPGVADAGYATDSDMGPTGAMAAGSPAAAPAMIGDFVGPGGSYFNFVGYSNLPIAGATGRMKITDNQHVLPQDRFFFNFNYFAGAASSSNATTLQSRKHDLMRYTLGVEKAFLSDAASLELRLPFQSGLKSYQPFAGTGDAGLEDTEIGNVALALKGIVFNRGPSTFSAGLAMVFPTAKDAVTPIVIVENDSFHLQPFAGWLWQPNESLFMMTFVGFDFDASGYPVWVGGALSGKVYDQSLAFLDWKLGRWLYRNPCGRWLTGVAPTIELHYAGTMSTGNTDPSNLVSTTIPFSHWDNLNITAGLHFQYGPLNELTVFGAAPLVRRTDAGMLNSTGMTSSFDGEFGVQFTRRY